MARGYDGTIRIDTSIDDKGFNAGMAKLGASAKKGLSTVVKTVGKVGVTVAVTAAFMAVAIAGVAVAVVGIGIALVKAGIGIAKFGVQLIQTMAESVDKTSKLGQMLTGLTTSFNNVKGAVYGVAATILQALLPYIQQIVEWLIRAANYTAMFIAAWTGQKTVMQYVAGSIESSADAAKDLADNTKAADKAAKGALAAFDDLNVLSKDTAETTGPAGPEPGKMQFVETPVSPEIVQQVEEVKERIHVVWQEIGEFLQDPFLYIATWIYDHVNKPIEDFFRNTWANIKEWARDLWDRILENWETVKTRAKEQILDPIKKTFSEAWEDIKAWASDLWDRVLENWETVKTRIREEIVEPIKKSFSEAWEDIKAWAINTWNSIQTAWENGKIWFHDHVTEPLKTWFSDAWDNIKQTAGGLWDWIVEKWQQLGEWFKTNVTDPIKEIFTGLWDGVKQWSSDAWTNIQGIWTTVTTWFKDNVTDPVKGFFSSALEDIKGFFNGAWETIKSIWGGAGEWIRVNITDPIQDKFNTALDFVKTKWETIWGGLGDFFKNTVNSIIDFINGMLWGMTEGINAVVGALNSLSITIPEWVPGIGGNSFGVNLPYVVAPQIPYLATGAVIPPNSEFLAMLGDQRSGRNLEAPESLIRQIIQEEMGRMETEIKIEFGGTLGALVRELKPYIDRENVRVGRSLATGSQA